MAFFSNLFNQAGKIDILTRQRNFVQEQLEFAQDEIASLKKDLRAERDKRDKFVLRHCDIVNRLNKLPEKFVTDVEPKPEPKPIVLEPDVEASYWTAATQHRDMDIEEGLEVPDLQTYFDQIKADPDKVFI